MKKVVAVISLLILSIWILANLLQARPPTEVETPLDLDFKNAGRGGGLAFYLECKQLWPGTRRMGWERHWQERRRIVVSVRYCASSTLKQMLDWVREGHEAVFFIYAHEGFLSDLKVDYLYNSLLSPEESGLVRRVNGPLLKDQDGSLHLYLRKPLGRGQVTVMVDPWCVSNDGLDRQANPELARQLVNGESTFLCPSSDLDWESLLLLSPWTRVAMLGAIGLLILYARNHYLPWQRPRFLPPPQQRSMLEFVDAAGWLFQRVRAYRLAAESLERGAAVRLRRNQDERYKQLLEHLKQSNPREILARVREFQEYLREAGR
jgi:hypothetical protein